MVLVSKFAKQIKIEEVVVRDKEYKFLGLRLAGNGLFHRETKNGSKTSASKVNKVKEGDFIYSRLFGWRGAFAIVPEKFDGYYVSNEFPIFEIDEKIATKEYILRYFLLPQTLQEVESYCMGATKASRNRFKESKFLSMDIPLPDTDTQRKIMSSFKQFSINKSILDKNDEENIILISKLRQSILSDAVCGKLVPQDPKDEPASVLLEKIKAEKEKLIREKKIKKEKPLPPIKEDEIPYELPKGWAWVRLNELLRFIDYRGRTPPKTNSGIRLITAKNVKMNYISDTPYEYISEKTYVEYMTRGFPQKGDLLITTEATMGNIAMFSIEEKVAFAQRVIILQKSSTLINNSYIKIALMSQYFQNKLIEKKTGLTAKGIKASRLKNLLVPFPPFQEQKRIVEKVNQLISFCDELEKEVKKSQTNATRLMDSVLREAFEVSHPDS